MAQSLSHQQDMVHDGWLGIASTSTSQLLRQHHSTVNNNNRGADQKHEREIIHSGQFMVSHFEAEAQDDEDNGILMPDDDENCINEINTCNDVQLLSYSPNYNSDLIDNSVTVPVNSRYNSSAVIDISLAKLFKCMNLAYK